MGQNTSQVTEKKRAALGSVTDNVWFWVLLFSATSAVVLVAAESKFDQKQKRIETRWLARQVAPNIESNSPAAVYNATAQTPRLVSTRPLLWLAVFACLVSWVILLRQRQGILRGRSHFALPKE